MTRPLNYTTKIAAKRTAQQCVDLLADSGADHVGVEYQDRQPIGLGFAILTPLGPRNFRIPVNIDGVSNLLRKLDDVGELPAPGGGKGRGRELYRTREHAANVAWRVAHDWLEAQLAIIEAGMVTLSEVMLPYLQLGEGRSMWTAYQLHETEMRAIGS